MRPFPADRHKGLVEAGHDSQCALFADYYSRCTCGAWQRNLETLNRKYRRRTDA